MAFSESQPDAADNGDDAPAEHEAAVAVNRPEIIIGMVSPVGIYLHPTCAALQRALDNLVRYTTATVRVSGLIDQFSRPEDDEGGPNGGNRFRRLMNAGDRLRRQSDENAVCAMLA